MTLRNTKPCHRGCHHTKIKTLRQLSKQGKKQGHQTPQKVTAILMSRRSVEDSRRFDHFPLSLHYFLAFAFAPKISNTSTVPLSWTPSSLLLPPLSNPADQPEIQIVFTSPTSRHPLWDTGSRSVPAKTSKTSPSDGGDWRRRRVLTAEVPTERKDKNKPMDATNCSQAIEGKKY